MILGEGASEEVVPGTQIGARSFWRFDVSLDVNVVVGKK